MIQINFFLSLKTIHKSSNELIDLLYSYKIDFIYELYILFDTSNYFGANIFFIFYDFKLRMILRNLVIFLINDLL